MLVIIQHYLRAEDESIIKNGPCGEVLYTHHHYLVQGAERRYSPSIILPAFFFRLMPSEAINKRITFIVSCGTFLGRKSNKDFSLNEKIKLTSHV